ncbi:MAG TPA: hypothetical protein VGD41_16530, partial [Pyrinomonadaceae bacterium]
IRPLFAPVRMKPSLITSVMLQQIRDEHVKFMEARRKGGEASGRKRKGNSDLMRALVAKRWCEQDTNKDTNKDTNAYEPPTPSPSTGTEERKRAQEDSESSSGGDVKVPTLAEVLEWGKIDGYPEEVCRDFYDFEAGLGWMHGNTRIRDPRRWLKRYFNRSRGPKRAPRAASLLWQSKTRLDQLKSMWEAHPGHPKNAYETPATSEELEEFEKITAEMKQLQRQIALGEQPSTNA